MSRKRVREETMLNSTPYSDIQNGEDASCSKEDSPIYPVSINIYFV